MGQPGELEIAERTFQLDAEEGKVWQIHLPSSMHAQRTGASETGFQQSPIAQAPSGEEEEWGPAPGWGQVWGGGGILLSTSLLGADEANIRHK